MTPCPHCGHQNRSGAKFCQKCGQTLSPVAAPEVASVPPAPVSQSAAPGTGASTTSAPAATATAPLAAPLNAQGSAPPPEDVASAPTKPLTPPDFAALPPGAFLCERRYEVEEVLSQSPNLNAYVVTFAKGRHCLQCGTEASSPDEVYCAGCGKALAGNTQQAYLLRETPEAKMFVKEALLANRKLWHPGLLNIYHVFQEIPYGRAPRTYLLSERDPGKAAVPKAQTEEQVLSWGRQLAEGLDYLHQNGILCRGIKPDNIRLVDGQAKLAFFGLAEEEAKATPKQWFANDVSDLAAVLRDMLVNQPPGAAVKAIFDKALAADPSVRYATAKALRDDLARAAEALQRTDNVTYVVGRRSDTGMVREHNEDSLSTLEFQRVQLSESKPLGVYIVADGMGGHEAGEVASGLAITTLARAITAKLMTVWLDGQAPADYPAMLRDAVQEANRAVYDLSRKKRTDMGTTLVAALVIGSEAYLANVGDSRCYRLSQGALEQVTTDHSLVERLVASGQITRAQARVHPQRNYIYRTIGEKQQVEIDQYRVSLRPGDYLLLCSDGLHGMVEDEQIQSTALLVQQPQAICDELVRQANINGGDDNITVVTLQCLVVGTHP